MEFGIRSGTMVVTLPTPDGLVVVADKRVTEHNRIRGNSVDDSKTKIIRVSDRIGMFGMHTAQLVDARTGDSEFSADDVASKLAEQHASADPYVLGNIIGEGMVEGLESLLHRVPKASWPRTTFNNEQEPVFYEVVLFYLDSLDQPVLLGNQLHYRAESGEVAVVQKEYDPGPYVFGGLKTCMNLIEGSDPSYNDYRGEALIQQCRGALGKTRILDTCTASRYGRRLIEIASAHEEGISHATDCALLHKTNGFQWCQC
jgi:hypothetical protein